MVSLDLNEQVKSYLKYSRPAFIAEDGIEKLNSKTILTINDWKFPAMIDETILPLTPANSILIWVLKLMQARSNTIYYISLQVHDGTAIFKRALILL